MTKKTSENLPELTAERLLPEGVHECSLQDVEGLFGRFQHSNRRCELFRKLQEYVEQAREAGLASAVVVDGSFVMAAVDEPNDVDLILVMAKDWDLSATEIRPFEYNLVSGRMTRKLFGFDVFAVPAESEAEREMTEFFQEIGPRWNNDLNLPSGLKKGVVRIVL